MVMRLLRRLGRAAWARVRALGAMATARISVRRRLRTRAGDVRNILVVCYGNIYRSPLAAACLSRHLSDDFVVRSAGFHPRSGRLCPDRHIHQCEQNGYPLADHRSSVLSAGDLTWADLVILMDRHNYDRLIRMGAPPSRLIWLGSLSAGDVEIPDPYGLDDRAAAFVIKRIIECSEKLVTALSGKAV